MGLFSKLKNGDTSLKSLRYGRDTPGGGDSGQPFIKKPIPENGTNNLIGKIDGDGLLRGGVRAPGRAIDDVLRLTKYLFNLKNPSGLFFTLKQNILSRVSPKTESSFGSGYLKGAVNAGVYTPLSTLLQAGEGYLGFHNNLLGLDPTGAFPEASLNKYEKVAYDLNKKKNNKSPYHVPPNYFSIQKFNPEFPPIEEKFNPLTNLVPPEDLVIGDWGSMSFLKTQMGLSNRLLKLWENKGLNLAHPVKAESSSNVLKYGGGPGSILGIGQTSIKFSTLNDGITPSRTGVNRIDAYRQGGYIYSKYKILHLSTSNIFKSAASRVYSQSIGFPFIVYQKQLFGTPNYLEEFNNFSNIQPWSGPEKLKININQFKKERSLSDVINKKTRIPISKDQSVLLKATEPTSKLLRKQFPNVPGVTLSSAIDSKNQTWYAEENQSFPMALDSRASTYNPTTTSGSVSTPKTTYWASGINIVGSNTNSSFSHLYLSKNRFDINQIVESGSLSRKSLTYKGASTYNPYSSTYTSGSSNYIVLYNTSSLYIQSVDKLLQPGAISTPRTLLDPVMGSEYLYNSPIPGKIYQQITDGEVSSEIFKEKRNYRSSTYLPNPKSVNIDKDIQPSFVGLNTERYDGNGNLYRTPTQLQINQNLQETVLGKSSLTHIRSTSYTPYNNNPFKFTKNQQSELIFNRANVYEGNKTHDSLEARIKLINTKYSEDLQQNRLDPGFPASPWYPRFYVNQSERADGWKSSYMFDKYKDPSIISPLPTDFNTHFPIPNDYRKIYKELLTPRTVVSDDYYVWYNDGTKGHYQEHRRYYLAPTQFEINQKHEEFDKEASSAGSKILHPSYWKTRREELGLKKCATGRSPFTVVKHEVRDNTGEPGKSRGDYFRTLDKVSGLKPYFATKAKRSGASGKDGDANDFVHFNMGIMDVRSGEEDLSLFLNFRAYIDSFSDSYNANWKNFNYMGRGESFYKYQNFSRDINLAFTVVAHSQPEMCAMYQKLNILASSVAPTYINGRYMAGNLARLTVGGYMIDQPGIISSFSYEVPEEASWELTVGKGAYVGDELPMMIKVTGFKFTPIYEFVPQANLNIKGFSNLADTSGPAGIMAPDAFERRFITSKMTTSHCKPCDDTPDPEPDPPTPTPTPEPWIVDDPIIDTDPNLIQGPPGFNDPYQDHTYVKNDFKDFNNFNKIKLPKNRPFEFGGGSFGGGGAGGSY